MLPPNQALKLTWQPSILYSFLTGCDGKASVGIDWGFFVLPLLTDLSEVHSGRRHHIAIVLSFRPHLTIE